MPPDARPDHDVLILGAYGLVGRSIVRGLLERTSCTVRATGRDPARLAGLIAAFPDPRLSVAVLDASDATALAAACPSARIVVNCVGPYIINGYETAAAVVRRQRHYVDFAFEQFHYRRLAPLSEEARAQGVALITGAGQTVGLSSILCAHAALRLDLPESVEVFFLEGRMHDSEAGFSSFMNGALEPALGNEDFVDGRHTRCQMGAEIVTRSFPPPFGVMKLLSDPSIDSLILPRRYPSLRTVKNYFGLGMEIPPGFFPLMRLLNPYKRRAAYNAAAWVVRRIMRHNHRRQEHQAATLLQMLRVEVAGGGERLCLDLHFGGDFNCTACLPVLLCDLLARGALSATGLQTALDLIPPAQLFEALAPYRAAGLLDWTIEGTGEPRGRS